MEILYKNIKTHWGSIAPSSALHIEGCGFESRASTFPDFFPVGVFVVQELIFVVLV